VAFCWLYFDRTAGDVAGVLAASGDPGRLGRSAYHFIHPIMVARVAAAAERVLSSPGDHASAPTVWLVLGGAALYLVGHAAVTATVWRAVPWSRLAGLAALALPSLLATRLTADGTRAESEAA
jgi:low temperature requirement protein LtrA